MSPARQNEQGERWRTLVSCTSRLPSTGGHHQRAARRGSLGRGRRWRGRKRLPRGAVARRRTSRAGGRRWRLPWRRAGAGALYGEQEERCRARRRLEDIPVDVHQQQPGRRGTQARYQHARQGAGPDLAIRSELADGGRRSDQHRGAGRVATLIEARTVDRHRRAVAGPLAGARCVHSPEDSRPATGR